MNRDLSSHEPAVAHVSYSMASGQSGGSLLNQGNRTMVIALGNIVRLSSVSMIPGYDASVTKNSQLSLIISRFAAGSASQPG
jgi:hypothetical protein